MDNNFFDRRLIILRKKYSVEIVSLLWYARGMLGRKVSDAEVEQICQLLDSGFTVDDIAAQIDKYYGKHIDKDI